jgi:transposase InsO family protein
MYIVDCVCHFTRYVEGWAIPESQNNAVSIARAVVEKIVCRYGIFETLVSDRGGVFIGTLAAHVFRALRIKQRTTTAFHPQSNGMIERFHFTLKVTLKLWSHEYAEEWDALLQFAIFAYNSAFHTILQEVPHFLCHGYDARLHIDELIGSSEQRRGGEIAFHE